MLFSQLLVNNKIISLDLPVAEVYKKVWCATNEVGAGFLAWSCGFTLCTYAGFSQEALGAAPEELSFSSWLWREPVVLSSSGGIWL